MALAMGVYLTATQTLVARRHTRVLKRMRTTGFTDRGLLVAVIAPSVVLGLVQPAVFAVVNAVGSGPVGLPAILPAIVVLVAWPVAFGAWAARRFR